MVRVQAPAKQAQGAENAAEGEGPDGLPVAMTAGQHRREHRDQRRDGAGRHDQVDAAEHEQQDGTDRGGDADGRRQSRRVDRRHVDITKPRSHLSSISAAALPDNRPIVHLATINRARNSEHAIMGA